MVEHFTKSYPSPAAMKLYGGARHFQDLEREIAVWTEGNPILAPTKPVHGEPYTYELFTPVQPEVPLLEWSSRFGDATHNLRAALDLLTFEMCHLVGDVPAKPRQVYFPVVDDSTKWEKETKNLKAIPESLLQRMAEVQPWHAEDPAAHVLTLVTALDNLDKHRSTVGMLILPAGVIPPRLHPMPGDAGDEAWQQPWTAFSFAADPAFNEVPWPVLWQVEPAPMIFFEDRFTLMIPLQRWLHQETNRIFHYIASGTWPEFGDHPAPEWVHMPEFSG